MTASITTLSILLIYKDILARQSWIFPLSFAGVITLKRALKANSVASAFTVTLLAWLPDEWANIEWYSSLRIEDSSRLATKSFNLLDLIDRKSSKSLTNSAWLILIKWNNDRQGYIGLRPLFHGAANSNRNSKKLLLLYKQWAYRIVIVNTAYSFRQKSGYR